MGNVWFLRHTERDPATGCLLWTGARKKPPGLPYGLAWDRREKRLRPAHRVSHELFIGPIPEGHGVLHTCDNPPCVEPTHLFTGTQLTNERDKVAKGRQATGDRNGARAHPERLRRGETIPWAKLTDHDVLAMRAAYDAGQGSTNTLARQYGIRQSTCWEIVRRRTWAHLP